MKNTIQRETAGLKISTATTVSTSESSLRSKPLERGRLALLSLGHWSVDLYSSVTATLQPLLVERFGLSFTQAGIVGGMFMF